MERRRARPLRRGWIDRAARHGAVAGSASGAEWRPTQGTRRLKATNRAVTGEQRWDSPRHVLFFFSLFFFCCDFFRIRRRGPSAPRHSSALRSTGERNDTATRTHATLPLNARWMEGAMRRRVLDSTAARRPLTCAAAERNCGGGRRRLVEADHGDVTLQLLSLTSLACCLLACALSQLADRARRRPRWDGPLA